MRSQPAVTLGAQAPRIRSVPSSATSAGGEAVDLAASAGVHLDVWQARVLHDSLGERADGRWASFETALIVARQNGKGEVLLARELAGLFLFGERLIIHTAHEFKTSYEAFLRIKAVVDNCDDLRRKVKTVSQTPAYQGIELLNGNRLRFLARSKGSGRGFSGDLVILDEAYELPDAALGALLPTMSARPNPQLWYASSAGQPESDVLHAIRERGVAGTSPSLCYLEWSAPDDAADDDREAWAQANPAMGVRISEEFIERELEAMPQAEFRRERLGIWESRGDGQVISPAVWASLTDPASTVDGRVAFAVDTTPDHGWSSIAASGLRPDGLPVVDVVEHRPGTQWVVERVAELVASHRPVAVVVDPTAAAGSLLPDFAAAGVPVVEVSPRDVAQGCGAFFDAAVDAGTLRHLGQSSLNTALLGARQRPLADAWAWDRKKSADICPLVAATLAFWGFRTHQPAEPGVFFLDDLDLDDEGAPVEGL